MIETRSQNAVTGRVDPGNPETRRISATAVSARGYNLVVACRNPPSQHLAFGND
jgi:hypothetical protein